MSETAGGRRVGEYLIGRATVDAHGPISERVEPCESCGALVAPASVTEHDGDTRRVAWDYREIDEHTPARCQSRRVNGSPFSTTPPGNG